MVPVLRATDGFHANVVAARLGSEGIVTQLRGPDPMYPLGAVDVLVGEDDLAEARELLFADDVESAFDDDLEVVRRRRVAPWVAGALAGLLVVADVIAVACRH